MPRNSKFRCGQKGKEKVKENKRRGKIRRERGDREKERRGNMRRKNRIKKENARGIECKKLIG